MPCTNAHLTVAELKDFLLRMSLKHLINVADNVVIDAAP